jgi:hypothetical protein
MTFSLGSNQMMDKLSMTGSHKGTIRNITFEFMSRRIRISPPRVSKDISHVPNPNFSELQEIAIENFLFQFMIQETLDRIEIILGKERDQ